MTFLITLQLSTHRTHAQWYLHPDVLWFPDCIFASRKGPSIVDIVYRNTEISKRDPDSQTVNGLGK